METQPFDGGAPLGLSGFVCFLVSVATAAPIARFILNLRRKIREILASSRGTNPLAPTEFHSG